MPDGSGKAPVGQADLGGAEVENHRGIAGCESVQGERHGERGHEGEQVAGRDAACATIDAGNLGALSAALKGSYSVCIDKETGIMLQAKADSGSGSTEDITATDFGEPTAADFTPPATPSTIPGQ